jgi:hypothetical protein
LGLARQEPAEAAQDVRKSTLTSFPATRRFSPPSLPTSAPPGPAHALRGPPPAQETLSTVLCVDNFRVLNSHALRSLFRDARKTREPRPSTHCAVAYTLSVPSRLLRLCSHSSHSCVSGHLAL